MAGRPAGSGGPSCAHVCRSSSVSLALVSAPALRGQITDNPIPAPVEKRGLAVEIRDVVRLPDTRGLRPLDQDVSPAGWARPNYVRDLPDGRRFVNDSRGRLYLIGAQQPAVDLRRRGGGVSQRGLQPPGERLQRLHVPPRVREERPVLQRARRARARQPGHAELHSAGLHDRATSRTTTSSPSGTPPTRRRPPSPARGASCCASPTSSRTSRTPTATSSSTPPRSPGRPITACSTPAAAISASATAADRTPTTRARRSASTRSSAPSCASTRAARR